MKIKNKIEIMMFLQDLDDYDSHQISLSAKLHITMTALGGDREIVFFTKKGNGNLFQIQSFPSPQCRYCLPTKPANPACPIILSKTFWGTIDLYLPQEQVKSGCYAYTVLHNHVEGYK